MKELSRFGVSIPPELLERFDRKIENMEYDNRSEAVRDLIRDFLVREKWEKSDERVMGSLTIIYNHDDSRVSDRLTEIQHRDHGKVISTMHLHLDHHNCMEIIAIEGTPEEVKEIADRIRSTKGVKHGKLVATST